MYLKSSKVINLFKFLEHFNKTHGIQFQTFVYIMRLSLYLLVLEESLTKECILRVVNFDSFVWQGLSWLLLHFKYKYSGWQNERLLEKESIIFVKKKQWNIQWYWRSCFVRIITLSIRRMHTHVLYKNACAFAEGSHLYKKRNWKCKKNNGKTLG